MTEDELWDSALDAVVYQLGRIETSVHGMMPTASWLEVVRMNIEMLRKQPEVDVDEERLTAVEGEVIMLKQIILDMQKAIVEATSHKDMQASVDALIKPEE